MIQIIPPKNTNYWINQRALSFSENDLNDPNRVAVSLVSGSVIMAYVQGIIDYATDGSYEKWTLRGYSTLLVNPEVHYIYARLSRTDRTALIVFSVKNYNIDGSITTVTGKDENGNDITETSEPSADYFYIHIGDITATDGVWERELVYDSGLLSTAKGDNDSNPLNEMWELSKMSTPWLIRAKQWLSSFTVKGFVTLIGGLIFKNGETEKVVSDIKRSTDIDEDVPISDDNIPTTKYVSNQIEVLDERFIFKTKDDRSSGTIASDKGFEVGKFQEGTLGSGASIFEREGSTYGEVDFLKVRKKATFTDITVQELKHVGGEIVLSPAAMVCSKVEETDEGYKCYFNATDSDGRRIYNDFEVGDQARCQTFNLENNTYYWRLVISVGDDFIILSKTDCDTESGNPSVGDNISQLGNRNEPARQAAIILSAYGSDAPSYKQYKGVDSYELTEEKMVTRLSPFGNYIKGKFISESTGADYDEEIEGIRVDWDKVLSQTDKEFTMWFYDYDPSSLVLPESEWTETELKLLHEQDIFYNIESGHAWRYTLEDGAFIWKEITDAETIKALEKAAKAQESADEVTAKLNTITKDGVLSALEKKEVLKEWESIESSYFANKATAEEFGLTLSIDDIYNQYHQSFINLGTYMNGGLAWIVGATPAWLVAITVDQNLESADEYRARWKDYYEKESAFVNHLAGIARNKANEARSEADKANDSIDAIVSDSVLSVVEKKEVLKEWEGIVSAYASNLENAKSYGVDTTVYTNAYISLGTYLNGGEWDRTSTPVWLAQLSVNQSIDPVRYRQEFVAYYNEEISLLESVSKVINDKATEAKKDADSKKRVFGALPVPPYDKGDLWVNATYGSIYDNDQLVCVTARAEGDLFFITDWQPTSYGTTSVIKTTENGAFLASQAFKTDESGNVILKATNGIVTTDEYATLFGQEVDAQGIAEIASVSTYITNDEGVLMSNVKIKADNLILSGDEVVNLVNEAEELKIQSDKLTLEGVTTINESFRVDDDGTAHIGGFRVDGLMLTNQMTDGTYLTGSSVVLKDPGVNTETLLGRAAVSGSTGRAASAKFSIAEDRISSSSTVENVSVMVSTDGAFDNVAIDIDGGCIQGMAVKNDIVSENGSYYVPVGVNNLIMINTENCDVYLPSLDYKHDGYIVRVKRMGAGTVNVKMRACRTIDKNLFELREWEYPVVVWGRNSYQISNTGSYSIGDIGDCSEFVWIRDLNITVGNTNYYGAWVQYRMPGS